MKAIRNAFAVIGRNRRAYIVLNVVFYGLVVCGMVLAALNPAVQEALKNATRESFSE